MIALIHVPTWGDASLLEIVWLVSGLIATFWTVWNVEDSWKDRRSLRLIQADPDVADSHYQMIKLSAQGRLNSQLVRLAISLLIVTTGAVGVTQPNPLHGEVTWTGFVVTGALVAISLLTAARSFFDWRQRNLLYEMATGRAQVVARRLSSGL